MSQDRVQVKTIEVLRTPLAYANWTLMESDSAGPVIRLVSDAAAGHEQFSFGFVCCRSRRYHAESLTREWMRGEDDEDGVVYEVLDSAWIAELERQVWPEYKGKFALRHFIIYLEGLYEFAAESLFTSDLETSMWRYPPSNLSF